MCERSLLLSYSVVLVSERSIPTGRPPLVGEVSAGEPKAVIHNVSETGFVPSSCEERETYTLLGSLESANFNNFLIPEDGQIPESH
jgi:hypothetical protein